MPSDSDSQWSGPGTLQLVWIEKPSGTLCLDMSRWLRVLGLSVPVHTFSPVLAGREGKPDWGRIKFRVWEELRRPRWLEQGRGQLRG